MNYLANIFGLSTWAWTRPTSFATGWDLNFPIIDIRSRPDRSGQPEKTLEPKPPCPSLPRRQNPTMLSKCVNIHTPAGPPPLFSTATRLREGSDRWVPGTPPTLLRNAKIWTGARNGMEVVYGDVLLDKGLIVAVGYIPPNLLADAKARGGGDVKVLDVAGKWITPGLVDLHSHIGVYSSPALNGMSLLLRYIRKMVLIFFFQTHLMGTPILPWLRSIDGLNTHDASYELAMAGGVTTAQILPGSPSTRPSKYAWTRIIRQWIPAKLCFLNSFSLTSLVINSEVWIYVDSGRASGRPTTSNLNVLTPQLTQNRTQQYVPLPSPEGCGPFLVKGGIQKEIGGRKTRGQVRHESVSPFPPDHSYTTHSEPGIPPYIVVDTHA